MASSPTRKHISLFDTRIFIATFPLELGRIVTGRAPDAGGGPPLGSFTAVIRILDFAGYLQPDDDMEKKGKFERRIFRMGDEWDG